MNLFVPELGTELELTQDWTFTLYAEHRNESLWKIAGKPMPGYGYGNRLQSIPMTLPAGTVMKVARIYVRNGQGAYSSLTFSLKSMNGKKASGRFWAKLADVNQLDCKILSVPS